MRITALSMLIAIGVGALAFANVAPRIDDLQASRVAFSPNGDRVADAVEIDFRLLRSAGVTVQAIASSGQVVRTIHEGGMDSGAATLAWDGSLDDGATAPDDRYIILVSAAASGYPTARSTTHVRLDTTPPAVSLRSSLSHRDDARMVTVPMHLSEEAVVKLSVVDGSSRRPLQFERRAGSDPLTVRTSDRWFSKRRRARYAVRMEARDAAGNVRRASVPVAVRARPPAPKPRPVAPAPAPTAPTAPVRFRWPLRGVITSTFGPRGGRMHEGIDVGLPSGRPIYASAAGQVSISGWAGGYGNLVEVRHARGFTTRYAHMSRRIARRGQHVRSGQLLGYVGSTGRSTGPHLHFEIRLNGVARNPLRYLP